MFLGRHTCLPFLFEGDALGEVPLLGDLGRAPERVVLVGDRRRAARLLGRLEDAVDLAAWAGRHLGPEAAGRVAVGAGRAHGAAFLVVETQMGGPATEIVTREVLDERFHPTPPVAAVRVGTCGTRGDLTPPPEVVVATFATGWSGALEQARHGVLADRPDGARPPVVRATGALADALGEALGRVAPGLRVARGGVFSKDSLYAEGGASFAADLVRLDAVATEMELATIGPLAEERGVPWGGVMASAGTVPGGWYDAARVARNEAAAIDACLLALARASAPGMA